MKYVKLFQSERVKNILENKMSLNNILSIIKKNSFYKILLRFLTISGLVILSAVIFKSFIIEVRYVESVSMEPTIRRGDYILISKFSYIIKTPEKFPFTNIGVPHASLSGLQSVKRGEIVLFNPPHFWSGNPFVKRCSGIPGDIIEVREGAVSTVESNTTNHLITIKSRKINANFTKISIPQKGDTINFSFPIDQQIIDILKYEKHSLQILNDSIFVLDGKKASRYIIESNYYFMTGDNKEYSLDSRVWGLVPEENVVGRAILVGWSWDDLGTNWFNRISWDRFLKPLW